MLHHISWPLYWAIIVTATGIYYAVISVLNFKGDLFTLLKNKKGVRQNAQPISFEENTAIMGSAKSETSQLNSAEELRFAPSEYDDNGDTVMESTTNINDHSDPVSGEYDSLLHESELLVSVIHTSEDSKENFLLLFRLLTQKYPDLKGTSFQSRINSHIVERAQGILSFEISPEELNHSWSN